MPLKILKNCVEIYQLDPAKLLSDPGLAQQGTLKKTEVELELLTKMSQKPIMKKVMKDIFLKMMF